MFGTDPEFVITTINPNRRFVEGLDIPYIIPPQAVHEDFGLQFRGTTSNGKNKLVDGKMYKVIGDGAAMEVNIAPSTDARDLHRRLEYVLNTTDRKLFKYGLRVDRNNILGYFDCDKYSEDVRGPEFWDAVRFGCDKDNFPPEYAKRGKVVNTDEVIVKQWPLRYMGGHLHIQNTTNDYMYFVDNQYMAATILDFTVGLANTRLYRSPDIRAQELKRYVYYGHPGRVRLQFYTETVSGIEYRPLSMYWLQNLGSMVIIFKAATLAREVINSTDLPVIYEKLMEYFDEMYKINISCDSAAAYNLQYKVGSILSGSKLDKTTLEGLILNG